MTHFHLSCQSLAWGRHWKLQYSSWSTSTTCWSCRLLLPPSIRYETWLSIATVAGCFVRQLQIHFQAQSLISTPIKPYVPLYNNTCRWVWSPSHPGNPLLHPLLHILNHIRTGDMVLLSCGRIWSLWKGLSEQQLLLCMLNVLFLICSVSTVHTGNFCVDKFLNFYAWKLLCSLAAMLKLIYLGYWRAVSHRREKNSRIQKLCVSEWPLAKLV